jgi:hypothetical protein
MNALIWAGEGEAITAWIYDKGPANGKAFIRLKSIY